MQLSVAGQRLGDDEVLQDLFRAKTSPDNYLFVFYLPSPTHPAPAVGNEKGTALTTDTTTTTTSGSSPRTITVAFTCLDSPESGPKGTVCVARDASLLDLKKAIATKADLLLEDPAKPDDEDGDAEKTGDAERKEAPVYPGDITDPPPPPAPSSHLIKSKWRPEVLDFGLAIVGAGGRQFFSYVTESTEQGEGGLAKVLGLPVDASDDNETNAARHHVLLIRFGAKVRGARLANELLLRGGSGRLSTFVVAPGWVPPQCPSRRTGAWPPSSPPCMS